MKSCSIEGCEKPSFARSWCKAHHQRYLRHGDPFGGRRSPNLNEKCAIDECNEPAIKRGWCSTHYQRWRKHRELLPDVPRLIRGNPMARFLAKVDKNGPIAKNRPDLGRCWIWTAARQPFGYGEFMIDYRPRAAHRWIYEQTVGPVPKGLVLDHFACDNGAGGCANPAHVRPATDRENVLRSNGPSAINARKTHCNRGHEFTPENIYRSPSTPNKRQCRVCIGLRSRGLI